MSFEYTYNKNVFAKICPFSIKRSTFWLTFLDITLKFTNWGQEFCDKILWCQKLKSQFQIIMLKPKTAYFQRNDLTFTYSKTSILRPHIFNISFWNPKWKWFSWKSISTIFYISVKRESILGPKLIHKSWIWIGLVILQPIKVHVNKIDTKI